jgi:hypothetical protein
MSTRRQILQTGGAALAIASLPSAARASRPAAAVPAYLHRSFWLDRLGTDVGEGLRLDAVTDLAGAAARGLAASEDAFSLLLSGTGTPLAEGIHRLAGGDLFVAPVGPPSARQAYEVVVDRASPARAPDPAPVAPAVAIAATTPPAPGAEARFAFLRAVRVRRGRPGLQVELRFARGGGPRAVAVRVERDGVVYARGREPVRGRRALLGLRLRRRLPRGRYDVVVTGTGTGGLRTAVRREVVLR